MLLAYAILVTYFLGALCGCVLTVKLAERQERKQFERDCQMALDIIKSETPDDSILNYDNV